MKKLLISVLERCFLHCSISRTSAVVCEMIETLFHLKYDVAISEENSDVVFIVVLTDKDNGDEFQIIFSVENGFIKSIDIEEIK